MLDEILISEDILKSKAAELAARVGVMKAHAGCGVFHETCEVAFHRYLLFTEWPTLLSDQVSLSMEQCLYNRYYWFTKFSHLYSAVNGRDVGLEQQAFQILETSTVEVDWSIVAEIQERATREFEGRNSRSGADDPLSRES